MKEYCRYAIWDELSGVMLVCGEKYKINQNLEYVESFRCVKSHMKKVSSFARKSIVKGRTVDIVYWFGTPKNNPFRTVLDGGLVLGLK